MTCAFSHPKNTPPPPPPPPPWCLQEQWLAYNAPNQACMLEAVSRIVCKRPCDGLVRVDLHIHFGSGAPTGRGRSTRRGGGGPRGAGPTDLLRLVSMYSVLILRDSVVAQRVRCRLARLPYVGVLDLDERFDQVQCCTLVPPVPRLRPVSLHHRRTLSSGGLTSHTSVRLAGSWIYRAIKGSVISHNW